MDLELYDELPFTEEPFNEEKTEQMVQDTDTFYDDWLESLRS